ncbi:carboxymuconolactone decarboxylase family protein [Coralloluteibacterium stylophorae]|uniref:Carboxymuconolactone decarboxylase family protein n=1 Tax=Coralloluteibacterium stylophorae TaxID=1776034 RepID=A0A8J8AWW5_9GAMM|nr:carboxymuconolactone decarboxylase family protein [Coralloluteibacterium stylophorae]MBS7456885.1 carboxymuconolactone decarboxylase family protein [Coralloluteibacterium stylophorae]
MTARLDTTTQSPQLFRKFGEISMALKKSSLEHPLQALVEIRASQINGCTFCLDMHVKQATLQGEKPLRLHHVAGWRESTLFSPRERAALAWTEALTTLSPQGVSDELYRQVRGEFSEQEITELTYAVMVINGWNRLNVAFRTPPGVLDQAYGLDKAGLAV